MINNPELYIESFSDMSWEHYIQEMSKGGRGATIHLSKVCVVHLTVPFILLMPIQILTMEPLYCSHASNRMWKNQMNRLIVHNL